MRVNGKVQVEIQLSTESLWNSYVANSRGVVGKMTHHVNGWTLTPLAHRRLLTLRKKRVLRCQRCRQPLCDNDKIVSKVSQGRRYLTKYYHKICWEAMFI